MILLDTHALIWLDTADRRLGSKTRALIEKHWPPNKVGVSAISCWEAGMLTERGRFRPAVPIVDWRARWIDAGLLEFPLDGAILTRALDLIKLPEDSADRFIAATALAKQAALVTADEKILGWRHEMTRHDARTQPAPAKVHNNLLRVHLHRCKFEYQYSGSTFTIYAPWLLPIQKVTGVVVSSTNTRLPFVERSSGYSVNWPDFGFGRAMRSHVFPFRGLSIHFADDIRAHRWQAIFQRW